MGLWNNYNYFDYNYGLNNWYMPNFSYFPNYFNNFSFFNNFFNPFTFNYSFNFPVYNPFFIPFPSIWQTQTNMQVPKKEPEKIVPKPTAENREEKSKKSHSLNLLDNKKTESKQPTKQKKQTESRQNINSSYSYLSQKQAEEKAKTDTNLEYLRGGTNWTVSSASFITDIPFAKKGTCSILDKVSDMIGEKLVITSALGTGQKGNPHQRHGYASHHNAENPKLDIRSNGHGEVLAQKLRATGYFSRVSVESDHLDVQIAPEKYASIDYTA